MTIREDDIMMIRLWYDMTLCDCWINAGVYDLAPPEVWNSMFLRAVESNRKEIIHGIGYTILKPTVWNWNRFRDYIMKRCCGMMIRNDDMRWLYDMMIWDGEMRWWYKMMVRDNNMIWDDDMRWWYEMMI